jgi:DNA ligase-1
LLSSEPSFLLWLFILLKTNNFLWTNGTSKECIKLKIEFECDLKVIGMTEGTGKARGMMGSLTLGSKDGIIKTDCGTGFTDEARKAWWEQYSPEDIESYDIVVTVKANDIITKRNSESVSLFLPVFLEERLDKSEADTYYQCMKQLEAAKNGGKT